MNRKILIITIIVLAIIGSILAITQITSTLSENETNFAIADTASVTKIFMADMDGNSVLLERQEVGKWKVNQKYFAQKDMVQQFLKTLMYVTVRGPVAIAARDNVIRHMASHAVKVEIFQQKYLIDFWGIRMFQREKLVKTFYVGDNTQEKSGTYMKMERSDNPYIVYIPGFKGFLHTRFSTNEHEWRDHTVFNLFMKDIDKVTMIYPGDPEKSFIIENPDNRNFKLFSVEEGSYLSSYDTINLINYLSGFYDARFEYLFDDPAHAVKDSLLQTDPFQILTVSPKTGSDIILITYLKPNLLTEEEMEARYFETSDYPWDRERMWAFINDGTELVTIQYFVFGRILKPIQAFFPGQKERILEGIHVIEMQ